MLPNYPYAHTFFMRASLFLQSGAPLRTGRHTLRVSLSDVRFDQDASVPARLSAITGYQLAAPAGVVVVSVTPVMQAGGGELVAALDIVLDVGTPSAPFNAVLLRIFGLGAPLSVSEPGLVALTAVAPTNGAPIAATRADGAPLNLAWSYAPIVRTVVTFNTQSLTFPTPARNYRVDVDFSGLGVFADAVYASRVAVVPPQSGTPAAIMASENLARKTTGRASFTIYAPEDNDPQYELPLTVDLTAQVAGFGWSTQALTGAAVWSAPVLL